METGGARVKRRLAHVLFDIGCKFIAAASRLTDGSYGWSAGVTLPFPTKGGSIPMSMGRGEVFAPYPDDAA